MTGEPERKRHPVGLFDAHAKHVLSCAQREAERRGGKFLISGLLLYSAANLGDVFARRLNEAMNTELDSLNAAVDAEWRGRSPFFEDDPVTLVNEACTSVAAGVEPGSAPSFSALLAAMLRYPNSMASRVVRRVDVDPVRLAERLSLFETTTPPNAHYSA